MPDPLPPRHALLVEHHLAQAGRLSRFLIHELNNQLTGITGYAQLLLHKTEDQRIAQQLERILNAGERAQALIENFREATQLYSKSEPVALGQTLEAALRARRFLFAKRNIELREEFAPNLPILTLNPGHVQLAFGALLDNAYEATAAQGTGVVTISAQPTGDGGAVVEIHDTGSGTDARPEPWQTSKDAGTHAGLGLTIAMWIADATGGSCEAHGQPDGGFTVRWTLGTRTPDSAAA